VLTRAYNATRKRWDKLCVAMLPPIKAIWSAPLSVFAHWHGAFLLCFTPIMN
jgi:hypothetical protein